MSESQKVVIDDKEYAMNDFTDEQKYFVSQLSDIQTIVTGKRNEQQHTGYCIEND